MNRFPRVLGVRAGYDPAQVDALVRRIEGTLGRGTLDGDEVTADEIRLTRFRTRRGGYHEKAVDYALEAFIVAIETRAPEEPAPAAETSLEAEAVKVERAAFRPGRLGMGYDEDEVDAFLDRIVATLRGTTDQRVSADDVRSATFSTVMLRAGYAVGDVDAFLTGVAGVLEQRVTR
ncbi:DivIVA domain-containing protein [Streptosporangium sp. KLBMP 9127]|nr:DivIVA domain-containing protein [Streptosporangium sp. KLBMP 9127]